MSRNDERRRVRDGDPAIAALELHFQEFLEVLGAHKQDSPELDLGNTAFRVAKMYRRELLASYLPGAREEFLASLQKFELTRQPEMLIERDIPFSSLCAHHLLPFHGVAHVGYVPGKWIAGLSKLVRVVNFHAAKLQTQETFTSDIAQDLIEFLDPSGVGVRTEAVHLCMACRGVRVAGVSTVTTALRGVFQEPNVKAEFHQQLSSGK